MTTDYAVRVVIPPQPNSPEPGPIERRVGPYASKSQAEHIAASYSFMLPGSAPAGTVVDVVPYATPFVHLDPEPPLDTYLLADAIDAEPERTPGVPGFPDLFARLHGRYGYDDAVTAWRRALDWSDHMANAAADEAAADEAARVLYDLVVKAAARTRGLYSAPALTEAATLTGALLAVGERFGVPRAAWEARQAAAALDAIREALRRELPVDANAAAPLVSALADRLAEHGQGTVRLTSGSVQIARLTETPTRFALVVSLTLDGWDLSPDTGGAAPVVAMHSPFTVAGAQTLADLVAAVNRGEQGNPFADQH